MNIERLNELLEIPYETLVMNNEYKKELTEYYKYIFSSNGCSTCKDMFQSYYKKLIESGVEKLSMITEGKFKLRTNLGVSVIQTENGTSISNANMNDDVCIEFLKENPNRIGLFEVYPDNWLDLINNKKENNND